MIRHDNDDHLSDIYNSAAGDGERTRCSMRATKGKDNRMKAQENAIDLLPRKPGRPPTKKSHKKNCSPFPQNEYPSNCPAEV